MARTYNHKLATPWTNTQKPILLHEQVLEYLHHHFYLCSEQIQKAQTYSMAPSIFLSTIRYFFTRFEIVWLILANSSIGRSAFRYSSTRIVGVKLVWSDSLSVGKSYSIDMNECLLWCINTAWQHSLWPTIANIVMCQLYSIYRVGKIYLKGNLYRYTDSAQHTH